MIDYLAKVPNIAGLDIVHTLTKSYSSFGKPCSFNYHSLGYNNSIYVHSRYLQA